MPDDNRHPRTRLKELRRRIVASVAKLLVWGKGRNETLERRGERDPVCTNCGAAAISVEVRLCEDCAEDCPDLKQPIVEARRLEAREQEWKDNR